MWRVGLFVFALLLAACSSASRSSSHDYGTVHTRFGDARIECGHGTAAPCGMATVLQFPSCSTAINDYINATVRPPDPVKQTDAATRALVNNMRPPSGSSWMMGCTDPSSPISISPG